MDKGDTYYEPSECPYPSPSCVVRGITNFTNAMFSQGFLFPSFLPFLSPLLFAGSNGPFCSSENNPTAIFPCPLIFVIHLIGDVHQPLHCGYGYDYGGNLVKVTFFGEQTELHAVWDSGMIYHYLNPTNGDWYALYQHLSADLAANPDREKLYGNITNPVTWANESISYVVNDVYNFDPVIPKGFSFSFMFGFFFLSKELMNLLWVKITTTTIGQLQCKEWKQVQSLF